MADTTPFARCVGCGQWWPSAVPAVILRGHETRYHAGAETVVKASELVDVPVDPNDSGRDTGGVADEPAVDLGDLSPVETLIVHADGETDLFSDLVQQFDQAAVLDDVSPADLVALLGSLSNMGRFLHMLQAQVCDTLTTISAQAAGAS
jgi:hypothetical protein